MPLITYFQVSMLFPSDKVLSLLFLLLFNIHCFCGLICHRIMIYWPLMRWSNKFDSHSCHCIRKSWINLFSFHSYRNGTVFDLFHELIIGRVKQYPCLQYHPFHVFWCHPHNFSSGDYWDVADFYFGMHTYHYLLSHHRSYLWFIMLDAKVYWFSSNPSYHEFSVNPIRHLKEDEYIRANPSD